MQATLQELADLQTQLMDLQSENERLLDEKNVLLESLCRQTEKLEDSRSKVDTLQELLLKGKEGDCCTEREQKLVDLLKVFYFKWTEQVINWFMHINQLVMHIKNK